MKKFVGVIAIITGLGVAAWAAEKVTEAQLPAAVQKTLTQQKGTDTVKEIEKTTRNGQTIYEVELSRRGLNPKLVIAEDGSVVRDVRADRPDPDTGVNIVNRIPTMRIADVPAAVRTTIEKQSMGRKVADIDRETWDGKTVYEVEFEQTGRNAQVHIGEDGTIVKQERTATTPTTGLKGILLGTQLSDTPPAVQETIKREAKGLEIADIDKERRAGRVLYEVEFKNPGRNVELHIAEDGSIVQDSRRDIRGQGSPGAETGRTIGPRANNVTFNQVPPAVQAAISAHGDVKTIKEIERAEKGGRVIYTVELQKEGRNTKLQIAEDGTIIKDNRQ
jgi:uncharacterized membrane protein YkoI